MYCSSCGNKVSASDKFCSGCGAKTRGSANSSGELYPKNKFDLLKNLSEDLKKSTYNFADLEKLCELYPKRYGVNDPLKKLMSKQTLEFIFRHKFKSVIKIPLNSDKLDELSKSKQGKFSEDIIPVLDDIVVDIVTIGYLERLCANIPDDHSYYSDFHGIDTPGDAIQHLIDMPSNPFDFGALESGFKVPMKFTSSLGGISIKDILERNIKEQFAPSEFLSEGAVIIFFTLGWHLSRFDKAMKQQAQLQD